MINRGCRFLTALDPDYFGFGLSSSWLVDSLLRVTLCLEGADPELIFDLFGTRSESDHIQTPVHLGDEPIL